MSGKGMAERERGLIDAMRQGTKLTFSSLKVDALRVSQDVAHQVSASAIRRVLLSGEKLDPRGLRIRAARITGALDLRHVHTTVGVTFVGCAFDEDLDFEDAHISWLSLTGSRVSRLLADGLRTERALLLDGGFSAHSNGSRGSVRLVGARIGGRLDLSGATLTNHSGPALVADRMRVDGSMRANGRFRAQGAGPAGTLVLPEVHIVGQLSMSGASVRNDTGPAIIGEQLAVDGAVFMAEPFKACGHGEDGAVRLTGARLGSAFSLHGARIRNDSGPALSADGMRVVGDLVLTGTFRADGRGERGAVRLTAAHIGGQLNASGAHLINDTGPGLFASELHVDESLYIGEDFTVHGTGERGALRLAGAYVGGQLEASGATIENRSGPALCAERMHATHDVVLGDRFRAIGGLRLQDATIGGKLIMTGAEPLGTAGLVLDLQAARVKEAKLPVDVICAQLAGAGHSPSPDTAKVNVTGFTYTLLTGIEPLQWLDLIRHHTETYSPQPYQQLATILKSYGHDNQARTVLRAQQDDLRGRGDLGGTLAHLLHWAWGTFAGYGYRVRRVAATLAIMLVLAATLGIVAGSIPTAAGGKPVAAPTAADASPTDSCSLVERIGLGLDRGLPLASTGIRNRCDLDSRSSAGQAITAAMWLVQLAIWALATLAIAGYTGLIRKLS